MSEDIMFQEAIDAIRQGQRTRARDLLTRLLRSDQSNPEYWLWLSSVVDTLKEQIYCLQTVLRLDPGNKAAKQGLVLLGALPPEGVATPAPPARRKWEVETQDVVEPTGLRALWANPVVRITFFIMASLMAFGLMALGVFAMTQLRPKEVAKAPTKTPGPSPTFTYTPTPLNWTPPVPTATPGFEGAPPLWTLLEATYTPTPLYVNTPHVANEAFSIAQRAWQRGDIAGALSFFEQAQQTSPDAADISYYVAELHRQQGDYNQALESYNRAISIDPNFAPAYLGRARARLALDPAADVAQDLDNAVTMDPGYGEARLERAMYDLFQGRTNAALEDLGKAEELLPGSPLVYLYRAQIELAMGENEAALEDARLANQLDLTSLLSYRLLGQAAAANQDYEAAFEALDVYLDYEQRDPLAWLIQGQALYATGQYSESLEALEEALDLDKNLSGAMLYRGLVFIELDQGQKAVNDIYVAMQSQPRDFDLNLSFARALFSAGRLDDALGQINRSYDIAEDDEQIAGVYFYRAQILEAIGNVPSAIKDWNALLALPEEVVPEEWREIAESHVAATVTPAPTATQTPLPTKSPTPTQSPTPTKSPTVTPTAKASPTLKATATP
ncbi:MAG: tetratricopeptide repeat protein [Anaerolineales bacterium]|nr:tetratricopeptide repeat protein [Anaerolineales bacterium]